jgi:hypothetical protein
MANYNPSTIARIGDIGLGICVETGIMLNTTYMAQSQQEDFNVYGRIMLLNLFLEVTTDFGAEATLFQYTYSNASVSRSQAPPSAAVYTGRAAQ